MNRQLLRIHTATSSSRGLSEAVSIWIVTVPLWCSVLQHQKQIHSGAGSVPSSGVLVWQAYLHTQTHTRYLWGWILFVGSGGDWLVRLVQTKRTERAYLAFTGVLIAFPRTNYNYNSSRNTLVNEIMRSSATLEAAKLIQRSVVRPQLKLAMREFSRGTTKKVFIGARHAPMPASGSFSSFENCQILHRFETHLLGVAVANRNYYRSTINWQSIKEIFNFQVINLPLF